MTTSKPPLLTNVTYDVIKDGVTLVLPALIALYAGLATVWGWSYSNEVVATGGLLGVFFGVILKIAAKRYENQPVEYDGQLIVNDPDPHNDTFRLEFDKGLSEMADQKVVKLKVEDLLPPDSH